MLAGNPNARAVQFFLDGNDRPFCRSSAMACSRRHRRHAPPDRPRGRAIVGTQDDNAFYGATFDALNIWELWVQWQANPVASLTLRGNCRSPRSTRSSLRPHIA